MKETLRLSAILCLICLASALFLAFIFDIAEPRIIEQKRLQEQRAIEEVLPQPAAVIDKIEQGDLVFYAARDAEGNLVAYVFIAQTYGYSSDIKTAVSLDATGNIIKVKILEQAETPGIGSRITEDEFLNQFKNKHVNERFDTITGATISSEAVIDSIKQKAKQVLSYER